MRGSTRYRGLNVEPPGACRSDSLERHYEASSPLGDLFVYLIRADVIARCQAVRLRGSRTITGVSVDRRTAYASSLGSTATQRCHNR